MKIFAMMAMGMAMMAQGTDMFADEPIRSSAPLPRKLTDEEKYRLHAAEKSKWHEYTINGEVIKARNKVDARKIYNKRHGIAQKRK